MPACQFETPLGACSLDWEGTQVTRFGLLRPPLGELTEPPAWVRQLIDRVQTHLQAGQEDFVDVAYAWDRVTPFQQRVYQAALETKAGATATYGDLAKAISEVPAVSRAVGVALGQNPWPLLVPCHRFVGADGKMTGFSAPGGTNTKLQLLALEGNQLFPV